MLSEFSSIDLDANPIETLISVHTVTREVLHAYEYGYGYGYDNRIRSRRDIRPFVFRNLWRLARLIPTVSTDSMDAHFQSIFSFIFSGTAHKFQSAFVDDNTKQ